MSLLYLYYTILYLANTGYHIQSYPQAQASYCIPNLLQEPVVAAHLMANFSLCSPPFIRLGYFSLLPPFLLLLCPQIVLYYSAVQCSVMQSSGPISNLTNVCRNICFMHSCAHICEKTQIFAHIFGFTNICANICKK